MSAQRGTDYCMQHWLTWGISDTRVFTTAFAKRSAGCGFPTSAGLDEPCLGRVTILLSAALGRCTLSVLAQTRQITFNVLLVLGLGFLRSLIINTEKQDRTVVSLRQGRQFDVGSKITCRSEKGRGSPCVSAAVTGPYAAHAGSAAEVEWLPDILLAGMWGRRAQHKLQRHPALCLIVLQGSLSCFAPALPPCCAGEKIHAGGQLLSRCTTNFPIELWSLAQYRDHRLCSKPVLMRCRWLGRCHHFLCVLSSQGSAVPTCLQSHCSASPPSRRE